MAYNKTTWQTGDTITAEKLNNIENGIEYGCPLIIHATPKEGYTWYSSLPLPCDLDVSCSDLLSFKSLFKFVLWLNVTNAPSIIPKTI